MPANTGGLAALRKIQIGKEVTPGTVVTATAKLMGLTMGHSLHDRHINHPADDRGELIESFRSFTSQYDWKDQLKGNATYEDLLYLLRMAIVGGVTPSVVDTSARKWVYEPSYTAANNPDTCTLEFGDDNQEYKTGFVFATDLGLSGQLDQAVQVEANIVGNSLATGTFTGALADRTVEDVIVAKTKLYIDDSGGTIGTTQVTGKLLDWAWKLPKHFMPAHRQDGTLDYVRVTEAKMQPTLELTIETNEASTLRSKFTGETRQLIRLITTGSLVGAATALKTLQIDGAYKIDGPDKFEEKDAVNVVKLSLVGEYDATWAKLFQITVQNALATIA